MNTDNYFFVDGSSLLAEIDTIRKRKAYHGKKLNVERFCRQFTGHRLSELHSDSYRRFTFYFARNDTRIHEYLVLQDLKKPDVHVDIHIHECGKKLQGGSRVDKWVSEKSPPNYILDRLHRSEKAVDTQICCDALLLAGQRKLDRLFLYTNDYDFIPLCQTLKSLGANISLFRLEDKKLNLELRKECDTFSVVPPSNLENIFE